MERVILNVPRKKMQPLFNALLSLGIDRKNIQAGGYFRAMQTSKNNLCLQRISRSFILFDWEFFSNELEYE